MARQIKDTAKKAYDIYGALTQYAQQHGCSNIEIMTVCELIHKSVRLQCRNSGEDFTKLQEAAKKICQKLLFFEEEIN